MIDCELCSAEERDDALRRALSSKVFSRSEQLKAFLRYICEAGTMRPGSPLTEYVIGVEVLGRPEGYSPSEDSSVRTRAYELRQKLDRLYSTELLDEDIQISIPKGTYTPQYVRRVPRRSPLPQDMSPAVGEVRTAPFAQSKADSKSRVRLLPAMLALLGALAGSGVTWLALTHPGIKSAEPDPVLREAWGPLAQGQSTVALTVATPLSLVVGPLGHEVYSSQNYPVPPDTYKLFQAHRLLPTDVRLGLTFSDNMLAVGTMNAALICANTLRGFGSSFQLLPDRLASISALRGRNAILLGAAIDSEAIAISMQEMPLAIEFAPGFHEFVLRDRIRGTTLTPTKDAAGDLAEVYGLITVKESLEERNRHEVILFSGITSVGIQGAAEFFSSAKAMHLLQSKLRQEGASHFPSMFQVIVKCRCNRLCLLSADYAGHRIVTKD